MSCIYCCTLIRNYFAALNFTPGRTLKVDSGGNYEKSAHDSELGEFDVVMDYFER